MLRITKILNLNVSGHKDIEFIDIDDTLDTGLYIDPYVIQALQNEFCLCCKKYIDSFFRELFKACKEQNHTRVHKLLEYASEPNETNLGMKTISKYGKGATSFELTKIFLDFYKIVQKNPYVTNNPLALCMYIKNFDKDKMSDLITNIIRKELYRFTIEQLDLWGIKLNTSNKFLGYYWDYNTLEWKELIGKPFIVGNKKLLLVPKSIVRTRYVFNVECYIKQYILNILQDDIIKNNPDKCIVKEYKDGHKRIIAPPKKELYSDEVYGKVHKEYAFNYSSKNQKYEDSFIKDILSRIKSGYGVLEDYQLDAIVYRKYRSDFDKAS